MKLIVNANIGLGNAEKNAANDRKRVKTYARVYDTLATLFNTYENLPDILSLQECGNISELHLELFFGKAAVSNEWPS